MSNAPDPAKETWQQADARKRRVLAEARELPRERSGWGARLTLLLGIALWLGALIWAWTVLPERVPLHWGDASGVPDRWGSKTEELVVQLVLPLVLVFPMLFMSRLTFVNADWINAPNKEWWLRDPKRLVRFERLVREDLMRILTPVLVVMAMMSAQTVYAVRSPHGYVPPWVLFAGLGVVVVWMTAVVVWMYASHRYRPEQDPAQEPRG